VCDVQALCSGGSTCGGCQSGYTGDGVTCLASTTKLATVRKSLPTATCSGAAALNTATCTACANLGRGTALSGTTPSTCVAAGQTPCCNLPLFYFEFNGTTALQYPFIEFGVIPPVMPFPPASPCCFPCVSLG
jgi:hypothetical protein